MARKDTLKTIQAFHKFLHPASTVTLANVTAEHKGQDSYEVDETLMDLQYQHPQEWAKFLAGKVKPADRAKAEAAARECLRDLLGDVDEHLANTMWDCGSDDLDAYAAAVANALLGKIMGLIQPEKK